MGDPILVPLLKMRPHYSRDFKIQRRDGNENVAQKVNLRSFSLHRNYSYPLTLSNVGEPP